MRLVLDLLADDQVWVTLSGAERLLPAGADPDSPDVRRRHDDAIDARVEALVATRPQNLLWGSDWPHVGLGLPAPGTAEIHARLQRWLPDPQVRRTVLVDNPARRYGFPASGAVAP